MTSRLEEEEREERVDFWKRASDELDIEEEAERRSKNKELIVCVKDKKDKR